MLRSYTALFWPLLNQWLENFLQLQSEGGISLFLFESILAMEQHIVTPFSKVHQFRDEDTIARESTSST